MAYGRKRTDAEKNREDPMAAFRRRPPAEATPEASSHATVLEHEEAAAALFGGKRHRGSGAHEFLKSDASSADFQIEAKQTAGQSIGIDLGWVKKISHEAAGRGKAPAIHIRFLRDMPDVESDWVMMPASVFERLLKKE